VNLRVVTINTWKCDGPYAQRMDALAVGLAALEPDIVLCQEAFEAVDGSLSTWRRLARALDVASVFHPMRRKVREVEGFPTDSFSGLATLSRHPVLETTTVGLPEDPRDGPRAALVVAVRTPHGLVRVANTHLTHLRDRDDLRLEQVRVLLASAPWRADADVRLLGGDFNARPDHPLHTLLRDGSGGWVGHDAFMARSAGSDQAGSTIRRRLSDGTRLEARVDYLYLGAGDSASVEASRVVLDEPHQGVLPSDHFGVLVDLRIEGATNGMRTP
jgi:endonuclease/exonuclease/phosphatase family metal-dependent hydrolase